MSTGWEKSLKQWGNGSKSLADGKASHHRFSQAKVDEADNRSAVVASKSFHHTSNARPHATRQSDLLLTKIHQDSKNDDSVAISNRRSPAKVKVKAAGRPSSASQKVRVIGQQRRMQVHENSQLASIVVAGRARTGRPSSTSSFLMGEPDPADFSGLGGPQDSSLMQGGVATRPSSKSSSTDPALPEGVIRIDPTEDENDTMSYPVDQVNYLKFREAQEQAERNRAKASNQMAPKLLHNRANLSGWLIAVAHFLRCSQETLYQTINLLDKVSERCKFSSSKYQAIGIGCLLIATKLEEYHAADLDVLVKLADMSYTRAELVQTEASILQRLSFETWTVEPMPFLRWFIRAAQRDKDELFLEVCTLLVDTLLMEYDLWRLPPSLKAASAVFAALKLCPHVDGTHDWTQTLVHYTGYTEGRKHRSTSRYCLVSCAARMLELLAKALHSLEGKTGDYWAGLAEKYLSNSQHKGLLRTGTVTTISVDAAVARVLEVQRRHGIESQSLQDT